ncbi:transglutaminase TgpA family protein [Jeotgalibacillus marinus]|uniref:TransglutaminaseTgpA domain-containing protein n=1 Tax=Jeotgalibacillus marinus TaxID=86667 RepID=A0ABV3Q7J2_9BACL
MMRRFSWAFFVLYFLSFLLIWEWIRPIDQITNVNYLHFFVIFAGLALLLYFFEVDWRVASVIKLIYIIIVLQRLHFDVPLIGEGTWSTELVLSLWDSLILTVQQEWSSVSDVYRSLLFFIVLWLTTYLIHYWVSVRKQLLLFYVLTVAYVALLDTFSVYRGDASMVRIVLIGFLLMGLLTFQRILEQEKLHQSVRQYQKWVVPLAVMVSFSSMVAYAAPKAEPIWPDPVPFIQSYSEEARGGGVKRLGYGLDDSELGGPYVGDDSKVFDVMTVGEQYWRIETKDHYTGKGWGNSSPVMGEGPSFTLGEIVPLNLSEINEDSESITATMDINLEYSHLVYPYNPIFLETGDADQFIVDSINEKITSLTNDEPTELSEYEWTFREPRYSLTELRETTGPGEYEGTSELDRYLELPEELPDRVRELALEITEGEDNWYDKASAIEKYFSQSGFTYDETDVPVPEDDQDYVDQFLFETQRGYCDNFSTSMVVLLRAVDIPARWVKGYTEGERIGPAENGLTEYEVTNNNAHSWVEVFFPSLGWVPFEPTVGFQNNVSLTNDLELDTEESAADTQEEPAQEETQEQPLPLEEDGSDGNGGTSQGFSFAKLWEDLKQFSSENKMAMISMGIGLIAIATVLYRVRYRWLPHVLIVYFSLKKDNETYSKAYVSLLRQLDRYGLKRKDTQTLSAYAKEVDLFFGTKEMSKLTNRYEQIVYRQDPHATQWKDMRELWENLIKRTTG